jgi:hypothetical protein
VSISGKQKTGFRNMRMSEHENEYKREEEKEMSIKKLHS